MYTNDSLEAHLSALCFVGTAGLSLLLVIATAVLFSIRRRWACYTLVALAVLLAGYGLLLGAFSFTSYDRTVARGDEKYFCGMDCHIAYSVQNVERVKTMGDTTARGEFVVVTMRSHFDERTIAPRRGNGALTPNPPDLELVDGSGQECPISVSGQRAWEAAHGQPHSPRDPLRPGESYETTWVFEVPDGAHSARMLAGWHGFPSYVLIGDEASPGHRKTYFAL